MALPFSFASQPIHATSARGVPQASSFLPPLRFHPYLQRALGLELPPNSSRILAQRQASGRLPPLFSSSSQPAPAAKSVAPSKRPTARLHSQPTTSKSGRGPSRVRAVPVSIPLSRPVEATRYQPPPPKARARRAALVAAKSKARQATTDDVLNGQVIATPSIHHTKSLSTRNLQPEQSIAERARKISQMPGLGGLSVNLIKKCLESLPGTTTEVQYPNNSSTSVAGDGDPSKPEGSNQLALHENHTSLITEVPEMRALSALPLPGSSPQMGRAEPVPLEQLGSSPNNMEFPASAPVMGLPDWPAFDFPQMSPTTELPKVEPPRELEEPPAASLPVQESEILAKKEEISSVVTEAELSAALECIREFELILAGGAGRCETGITSPTQEDMESSPCAPHGLGHSEDVRNVGTGDLGDFSFGFRFLDDTWGRLTDLNVLILLKVSLIVL
ncbi:hypothetical protein BC826DRAFT_972779 [Russula brevipes]|nr:hypothetical protein BC826DRAFT_972779 [Russula brevipes]